MNDHEHRYFIFKTYDSYEPLSAETKSSVLMDINVDLGKVYVKVEYAVLGCNCGSVIKMKVKEQ